MSVKSAMAVLVVLGVSQCMCLWTRAASEHMTGEVVATTSELSQDDILEDMLDFVIGENETFQGRKKKYKKKLIKYITAALILKSLLLPKILAIVKFLTAKAYLLSIFALVMAAAVTSGKKKEQHTEHIINLVPKGKSMEGQWQAYRYWRNSLDESQSVDLQ